MEDGAVGHNFERDPPRDHPCLVWFNLVQRFQRRRFKCDLLSKYANLHNRYISAERKISQKKPEYMLNYSLPCSCSKNVSSFWLTLTQQWIIEISSPLFSIFSLAAILVGSQDHRTQFWKGPSKDHSTKVWLQLAQWFLRRRLKCEMLTDGRPTKSDDNSSPGLKAGQVS